MQLFMEPIKFIRVMDNIDTIFYLCSYVIVVICGPSKPIKGGYSTRSRYGIYAVISLICLVLYKYPIAYSYGDPIDR